MTNLLFRYSRISISIFVTLVLLGFISWFTMPKEEDPRLKPRFANIQVIYPGATAEEVYRLVVKPLEDELSKISELSWVDATARAEVCFC